MAVLSYTVTAFSSESKGFEAKLIAADADGKWQGQAPGSHEFVIIQLSRPSVIGQLVVNNNSAAIFSVEACDQRDAQERSKWHVLLGTSSLMKPSEARDETHGTNSFTFTKFEDDAKDGLWYCLKFNVFQPFNKNLPCGLSSVQVYSADTDAKANSGRRTPSPIAEALSDEEKSPIRSHTIRARGNVRSLISSGKPSYAVNSIISADDNDADDIHEIESNLDEKSSARGRAPAKPSLVSKAAASRSTADDTKPVAGSNKRNTGRSSSRAGSRSSRAGSRNAVAIGSSVVEHQQSNFGERHAASDVAAAPYVVAEQESKQQSSVGATASQEAAVQHVADDEAVQPQVPMDSTAVRLVPKVLGRLFLFVSLSDNVLCHFVHWLICSLACPQLHNRLAAPKGNALLLKWPLCFGNRQDVHSLHRQFRYIDLLRYNVSLQVAPAEVTKQVQLFLAGYESMLLGEVYGSAVNSRYKSLNTFIVDFSSDYRNSDWNEQRVFCSRCFAKDELFLGNWQRWVETITAITNSCAATLSHFVFTNDTFWGNHVYKLRLPDELYRALNFDRMLSEMPNLRTLHLPIRDYELAFVSAGGKSRCDFDQVARQKAWPVLRRMQSTEILPHLQRIVVQHVNHMINRAVWGCLPVCGMPCLRRETEIMMEYYLDTRYSEGCRNHMAPAATCTIAHYGKSKLFSCLPTPDDWFSYNWANSDEKDQQRAKKLTAAIAAFVNGEASVRERQQRLSVLNSMRHVPATRAVIGVPVVDWIHYEHASRQYEKHVADTITVLVGLMQTRRIGPCDVKIRFEEEEFEDELGRELNSNWSWGCMRPLLPFFAVGNDNVSDAMLDSMRIDMVLHDFFTFGDKVEEWLVKAQQLDDGSERLLLTEQKYRIPNINLSVYNGVHVSAGNVAAEHTAEIWVEAVEQQIMQQIRAFLRDAVDSYMRPDLSFYLYRSLKRVAYVFTVTWDVYDTNKQFREQFGLLLNARAGKFEQRLMREVLFADVWKSDEFGCSSSSTEEDGCVAQLTQVLKLSALQSISSNIHIRVGDEML